MSKPTFGITGLTEAQAKELAQLLTLSVKAERLNAVVAALLDAPIAIAVKANQFGEMIKPEVTAEEPAND